MVRLGNISSDLLVTIDNKLAREEGKAIRVKTVNGDLVCAFSPVHY